MFDDYKAIGYAVFSPARKTFLGKLGTWYTDVRMASVYAEPRQASAAMKRAEVSFATVVVPITLSVSGEQIGYAVGDAKAKTESPSETEKAADEPPTTNRRRRTAAEAA